MLKKLFWKYAYSYYTIGFIEDGLQSIMEHKKVQAKFINWNGAVKNNGSWYADPFILDVTDTTIKILVEEMPSHIHKGIITKLVVDRKTFSVIEKKVILELSYHLSFPFILRKNSEVYIIPENGKSGPLAMFRYDEATETCSYVKDICKDIIWDASLCELYDAPYLFGATVNDNQLDIYYYDENQELFVPYQTILSDKPDCRLAGDPYMWNDEVYYPAQLCDKYYGRAVVIKKLVHKDEKFYAIPFRTITSPHKDLTLGMHTLNTYKGISVIDVKGFSHKYIGPVLFRILLFILKIQGRKL